MSILTLPPEWVFTYEFKDPEPTYLTLIKKNLKDPDLIEKAIGKMNSDEFQNRQPYSLQLITVDRFILFTSVEYIFKFKILDGLIGGDQVYDTFDFRRFE